MLYLPLESRQQGVMLEFLAIKRKEENKIRTFDYILLILFPQGGRKEETCKRMICKIAKT